jgi:exopolyphosphatase/guanosine-5'-triphosphate,3'-diphosphate pyrophosphatase
MPKPERLASLDIGSNTIRLLVAHCGEKITEIAAAQKITRLGESAHTSGNLSDKAVERTISAVGEILSDAKAYSPFTIAAVATHAVRSAGNRQKFEEAFELKTGLPLTVATWEEEAELTLKGMETVINDGPLLLFDIGGGSTEFIYRNANGDVQTHGTDLGVVRLSESFISTAPLKAGEYEKLAGYINSELLKVKDGLGIKGEFRLVGTAGTVTSIAAMQIGMEEYDAERINSTVLKRDEIEELKRRIGDMTLEERSRTGSLKNGREDLIIPGFGIVLGIMERFDTDSLTVCDAGLREGIIIALKEKRLKGTVI